MDNTHFWNENMAETAHPLLADYILDLILQYFDGDRPNLTSCRLVCTVWNTAASRRVKKSLRWHLGGDADPTTSKLPVPPYFACTCKDELKFMTAMDNTKEEADVFRNFHWTEDPHKLGMPPDHRFLTQYGTGIVDLKLDCERLGFGFSILPHLHNLEHLELTGPFFDPIIIPRDGSDIWSLPKLVSLSLVYRDSRAQRHQLFFNGAGELEGRRVGPLEHIYRQIIEKATRLVTLELNTSLLLQSILQKDSPRLLDALRRLVTLRVREFVLVGLREEHFDLIGQRCPSLQVLEFHLAHGYSRGQEEALLRLVDTFRVQLEELHLTALPGRQSPPGAPNQPPERDIQLPDCPSLKKVIIQGWCLRVPKSGRCPAPNLVHLEASALTSTPTPTTTRSVTHYPKVIVVRLGVWHEVTAADVHCLAAMFPKLLELQCQLEDDGALFVVYKNLPKLRRLHLGSSNITDVGITGLRPDTLAVLAIKNFPFDDTFAEKVDQIANDGIGQAGQSIGALKDLEYFTIESDRLSRLSVYLGFVRLKELKYLKMRPYRSPDRWNQRPTGYCFETVPARALANNCSVLAKLDVCGTELAAGGSDDPEQSPQVGLGCGLTDQVIDYVKGRLPTLELVYGESESLTERIRTGKGRHVLVVD